MFIMENNFNRVYGQSLIELFDLIIDKIEGDGEYSLKDLQKILREQYRETIKRNQENLINEKIKEIQEEDEGNIFKSMDRNRIKKIVKSMYFSKKEKTI